MRDQLLSRDYIVLCKIFFFMALNLSHGLEKQTKTAGDPSEISDHDCCFTLIVFLMF